MQLFRVADRRVDGHFLKVVVGAVVGNVDGFGGFAGTYSGLEGSGRPVIWLRNDLGQRLEEGLFRVFVVETGWIV